MTEKTIDLRDCMRTIKKRRALIFRICLVLVIITLLFSFSTSPTYEAVTSLRVKPPKGLADSLLADWPGGSTLNNRQNMITYGDMLRSRTVVQAAIDKAYVNDEDPPSYEEVIGKIIVQPAKEADILYLKVQSNVPDDAQLLANTLTETLVSLLSAEQGTVREFIGQRLKESRQELEQAENALEQYKRNQKMIGPDVQSRAMVDKLAVIDKLVAENAVNLATAQAKLGSAQQQLAGEKSGFIADNQLIQQYKTKLADLEVELVSTLPKYADNHPKVVSLRAAINETKSKLNAEVTRVINAESASINPIHQSLLQGKMMAEADVAAASAQKRAIGSILANSEKELASLPAKEQGITRLMREAQVAQELYIMLDKRYEEARINEIMRPSDVKVLDAAVVPEKPIKPRKVLNAIIGALFGLFIGTATAFFLEYTNRPILNDQEAKRHLKLPVLGIIPDFEQVAAIKREPYWHRIRNLIFHRQT